MALASEASHGGGSPRRFVLSAFQRGSSQTGHTSKRCRSGIASIVGRTLGRCVVDGRQKFVDEVGYMILPIVTQSQSFYFLSKHAGDVGFAKIGGESS